MVPGRDGEESKRKVLWWVGNSECRGTAYIWSLVTFVFLAAVFPLAFYIILRRARRKFEYNLNELLNVPWYIIATNAFSEDCWFYEFFLLLRKISLSCIATTAITDEHKRIFNFGVLLMSLLLHQWLLPFRHLESNYAEFFCLVNLIILAALTEISDDGTEGDYMIMRSDDESTVTPSSAPGTACGTIKKFLCPL